MKAALFATFALVFAVLAGSDPARAMTKAQADAECHQELHSQMSRQKDQPSGIIEPFRECLKRKMRKN